MNMSWEHSEEKKQFSEKLDSEWRGVNMSIRIAQLLHRLGFAVFMDGDKKQIVIKRGK